MTRRCYRRPARPTVRRVRTPETVLAQLLAADPARPRLTFYDDTPGPTQGERIELSAKVLANWVAKAANALQDEFDAGPGSVVALDLPAVHWRTAYWAMAAWAVGATVEVGTGDVGPGAAGTAWPHGSGADVLVTADPGAETDGDLVLVTLAALARAAAGPVPAGAMDEARELATYGDRFVGSVAPEPGDVALRTRDGDSTHDPVSFAELLTEPDWPRGSRVHIGSHAPAVTLRQALSAWALDGSVVLVRGAEGDLSARLAAEGVTVDFP
jgi:uncharacterized protein (TIGR03089 family)